MIKPNATLEDLQVWARAKIQLKPDFVIGDDYLRRWWIIPRNSFQNVYLHHTLHSDDDRAFHDHPWDNTSFILLGGYLEHTPNGIVERQAGDIIHRRAEDLHRLEVPEGQTCVSLFFTGPVRREWGFDCPNGWRHWKEFTDSSATGSQIGQGCD